jgi:hypothetical protein
MKRGLKILYWSGATLLALAAAAFVLLLWPEAEMPSFGRSGSLRIDHVHVVDLHSGSILRDRSVVVAAGRIVRIAAHGAANDAKVAAVIDAKGAYAIPGLWDMHVHSMFKLAPLLHHPLYIANGVTHVRELVGCVVEDDSYRAPCVRDRDLWNRQVSEGKTAAPQIMSLATYPMNGPSNVVSSLPSYFGAATPEHAQQLVEEYARRGYDEIKVYDKLPRAAFFAAAETARRVGIPLVGHKPHQVSIVEASRNGLKSLEHARALLMECSGVGHRLRQAGSSVQLSPQLKQELLASFELELCREVFRVMRENGTWYTPTHLTRKIEAQANDSAYLGDARLKYLNYLWRLMWRLDAAEMVEADGGAEGRESTRAFYMRGLELTGEAHRQGVGILAGTDAPDTYVFPGSGLHDEMAELVRAGLSPLDALRAATVNPARYYGLDHVAARITEGAFADLVVVAADPLADIENIRKIVGVIQGDRWYDRQALDGMLTHVEVRASSLSILVKLLWGATMSPYED